MKTYERLIIKADNTVYTGKAITPKVKKSATAPKGLEYSVRYENNKNAGTAKVIITGKGDYTGKITRIFKILPKDITNAKFKSCTTSRIYNGTTTVPYCAGEYTVEIFGTGNYTGWVSVNNVVVAKNYVIITPKGDSFVPGTKLKQVTKTFKIVKK